MIDVFCHACCGGSALNISRYPAWVQQPTLRSSRRQATWAVHILPVAPVRGAAWFDWSGGVIN